MFRTSTANIQGQFNIIVSCSSIGQSNCRADLGSAAGVRLSDLRHDQLAGLVHSQTPCFTWFELHNPRRIRPSRNFRSPIGWPASIVSFLSTPYALHLRLFVPACVSPSGLTRYKSGYLRLTFYVDSLIPAQRAAGMTPAAARMTLTTPATACKSQQTTTVCSFAWRGDFGARFRWPSSF